MRDYSNFSVEDFIMDENFQEWVKHPTTENKLYWEKWLSHHIYKAHTVQQARLIILSMDFKKTGGKDIPKDLLLENIQSTIKNQSAIPEVNQKNTHLNRTFINLYYLIAASFIGLLISSIPLYFLINQSTENYSTNYGEIRNITLPDGSTMVLNANSSIQFNNNWESGKDREVWLEGEAFFDVSHKKNNQKFLVWTDHFKVEVLGTEFNVNTRRNNSKIVLNSGKIKLNRKGLSNDEIYMDPGELVEFSGDDKKITKKTVDPEQLSAWKNHQLVFKATRLNDIAQTLEDNYGWEIIFEEEIIKTYQFTGTVSTENIDDLLFTISEAFNIEILEENKQMIFKYKK